MGSQDAVTTAYRAVRAMLEQGAFQPGARLPGERQLAQQVRVSRSTLRLALAQLADEGALSAAPQRGWFVPGLLLGEPPSMLQSFTEMARARGLRPGARELSRQLRPATLAEADDLQVAPTAPVFELVRLRTMDGVPITVEAAILPQRLVPWLAQTEVVDASLYDLLGEHGIVVHRSAYTVQAINADEWTASLLTIAPGAAVLSARDVTFTPDRKPVMTTLNRYRGDAYQFTANLHRFSG